MQHDLRLSQCTTSGSASAQILTVLWLPSDFSSIETMKLLHLTALLATISCAHAKQRMPVLDDTLADMASMMGGSAKVEMTPPLRRDPALAMKDDTAAFVRKYGAIKLIPHLRSMPGGIDTMNINGITTLMHAAAFGFYDAAVALVDAGASLDLRSTTDVTGIEDEMLYPKGMDAKGFAEQVGTWGPGYEREAMARLLDAAAAEGRYGDPWLEWKRDNTELSMQPDKQWVDVKPLLDDGSPQSWDL